MRRTPPAVRHEACRIPVNQYCSQYLHYLQLQKNASPNTIASYRLDLERYVRYLERARVTSPGTQRSRKRPAAAIAA